MVSQIINGKEVAAGIRAEVAEEVLKLRATIGRPPKLVVIQVGNNPASIPKGKIMKDMVQEV